MDPYIAPDIDELIRKMIDPNIEIRYTIQEAYEVYHRILEKHYVSRMVTREFPFPSTVLAVETYKKDRLGDLAGTTVSFEIDDQVYVGSTYKYANKFAEDFKLKPKMVIPNLVFYRQYYIDFFYECVAAEIFLTQKHLNVPLNGDYKLHSRYTKDGEEYFITHEDHEELSFLETRLSMNEIPFDANGIIKLVLPPTNHLTVFLNVCRSVTIDMNSLPLSPLMETYERIRNRLFRS